MPFSLEDLLKFVRKDGISVSGSEAKQAKGCHSLASSSYSFQTRCHVGVCQCIFIDQVVLVFFPIAWFDMKLSALKCEMK